MDEYNEYDKDDKHGSAIDAAMESLEEMGIEIEKPNDMSDMEFEGIIGSEIDDAIDYIDNNISQDRNLATQYYRGEPFGDEEEGA